MDKQELIQSMRDAHQRMAEAIERIPDARLLEPAMHEWTGKDVIAHMAWWHDNSALVIESLRAGRDPYDQSDPQYSTDTRNERTRLERMDYPADLTRTEFDESFARLLTALEPVTDEELFDADRWPWLGEPLAEMILWDSSRHYEAHRESLAALTQGRSGSM